MKTFSSFSSVFFAFDNFDFVELTVTVSMENHAAGKFLVLRCGELGSIWNFSFLSLFLFYSHSVCFLGFGLCGI